MFGDEPVIDLEGSIHFETLLLARVIDWLATLSIDPDSEARRVTLSVFSELKAAYSTQSSLYELYFHQYDDKKVLEDRVRGAMLDIGSDSKKCRLLLRPVQLQNVITSTQSCSAFPLSWKKCSQ